MCHKKLRSPFFFFLHECGDSGYCCEECTADSQDISDIFAQYDDIDCQIIAASVRNGVHVTACALAGADIATVPYKVLEQMTKHPLTDQGIEKFKADYKAVFGE